MRKLIVSMLLASVFVGSLFAQETPLPPVGWAPSGSPVAAYGRLKVANNQVQSASGTAVQLRGMSFGWTSDVTNESPPREYYNERVVAWLAADWKVSLIRAAVGVSDKREGDGPFMAPGQPYKGNEATHKLIVKNVVNAAIWQGIYVIIDWHSHHAHEGEADDAVSGSKAFFREMAQIYKDYPNVLYEIYNEPLCQGCWSQVKSYAEGVIDAIRAVDANNIIIVGTPFYSQRIGDAAANKITGTNRGNLVYTVHFYCDLSDGTGTWDINYSGSKSNIPIFVSEFGLSESDGNNMCSGNTFPEANTWLNRLDADKVSWANWQVNNRNETSSILKMYSSSAERSRLFKGRWTANDLSTGGTWIRNRLRGYSDAPNRTYKVDITKEGEGTVTGAGNVNTVCDTATLNATGTNDTRFEGWIFNGSGNASNPYKLEVCYDKVGKAVFFPKNPISNSTFTVAAGWSRSPSTGNNAPNIEAVNGELVVTIPNAGTVSNRLVYHGNTSLTNGRRYRLTFNARATAARTVQAAYFTSDAFGEIAIKTNIGGAVSLTTNMAPYSVEFNMTDPTTTTGMIGFGVGGNTAGVTFDNVKLEDIGVATSVSPQTVQPVAVRPFKASFNGKALVLTGGNRAASVKVYDMAGRVRLTRNVQLSRAVSTVSLDKLPSGVYTVRYDVDGQKAQSVERIMLAR